MANYRTVTAVATVTQQTFNADGTVSETTFNVTADAGKVIAIDPYITIEQTDEGAVVTVTDAHGKTTATIYNGKDGQDGQDGQDGRDGQSGVDGFSPTATVSKSGNVATISITDKSGTTSAQVVDGAKGDKGDKGDPGIGVKGDKGDPGADGQDGADGFSPVASVSKSGNTTTISITDKNGTTTATVNDGVGDVASVNGKTGAVVLDADDVGALPDTTVIPTKTSDLTNDSDFMSGMTILAYGKSTWNDFITAYNSRHVVYCRASSSSNPASGAQTRMAFMAYVNKEVDPTEVEFQYYRSVSSHSATQQGDQVYVYKLNKTNGWTVIVREAYTRIVAGTGIKATYSSGVLTIALDA